ncbi:hypothetical protein [Robiginitalea sp. SC105]|uniref:hypothetical protein n=1 Tax=Robiginitalea sp. SC105 TaxID=2762332 RepID=UPI001639B48F|nr:hypothetical protein [Robiginitalea sp. SC105]MBC2840617.1 hypothetical protein [Robiginitalea sp. SC105]
MNRHQLWLELTLAIVITISPFVIFTHLFFSPTQDYLTFFESRYFHGFSNNQKYIWLLLNSFCPLLLNSLFFICTYQKWRFFILPIIALNFGSFLFYFYQDVRLVSFVLSKETIIPAIILLSVLIIIDRRLISNYRRSIFKVELNVVIKELLSGNFRLFISKSNEIINSNSKKSLKNFTCKVYHLIQISDQKAELIKREERHIKENFLCSDLITGFLILAIGSLYLIYDLFPRSSSLEFAGFNLPTFGFRDIQSLIWYSGQKLAMISLLSLWFISSMHWWRWSLMSPIALYSYQFWDIFSVSSVVEEGGNLIVLPMTCITLIMIVCLGTTIRNYVRVLNYRNQLRQIMERNIRLLSNGSN